MPQDFKVRVLTATWIIALTLCAIFVGWHIRVVLLLLFAGCLWGIVLRTITLLLMRWLRLPQRFAFPGTLLLISLVVGLGVWLRGPALFQQFSDLASGLPAAVTKVAQFVEETSWGRWLIAQSADAGQLARGLSFALSKFGGAMTATGAAAGGLLIVLFVGFYLAAEPNYYRQGLRLLIPGANRKLFDECVDGAVNSVRYWLMARVISMTFIGLAVGTGLLILGIPFAGTLGIIAALFTFIPNLGPVLSAIPAALIAFSLGPEKCALAVLVFCLAHFLEGNIVTPIAERRLVKLPPVLTLSVQLSLAALVGSLGIVLAAPLLAALFGALRSMQSASAGEAAIDAIGGRRSGPSKWRAQDGAA